MKKILFVCLLLAGNHVFSQQIPPPSPCSSNPVYRQFDFWIGDWEAFNLKGNKAGDSHIERLLDSCVILENWTSTQLGYKGKSYNTYNAIAGKWEQFWVDNKGGTTHYLNGQGGNDAMIFVTAPEQQVDGTSKTMRLSFHKLNEDKVRQHGESSLDAGKTWKTDFDLEYRRKK